MDKSEEPFDPKRTMQVDPAEVAEVVEATSEERRASARKTPPPLPAFQPREAQVEPSPGEARSPRQRLLFGAIVAAMLAVAAIGGWVFANFMRPAPASSIAPASAATAAASAAPTMTLPSVEIR